MCLFDFVCGTQNLVSSFDFQEGHLDNPVSPMFSSLASCAWRLQAPSPLTWLCRQSQLQAPWQWYCHWLMIRKQLTGRGSEQHKQLTATRWHFRAHLLKQLSQHFMSKLRARMEVFQEAPLHWTRAPATMFPPLTWPIWDLALIPLMQSQVWDSHQSASILTYWTNLSEHPQPLLQRQNLCFPRHSQSTMIQPLGRILFSIKSTVCQVLSYIFYEPLWALDARKHHSFASQDAVELDTIPSLFAFGKTTSQQVVL